MSDRQRWAVAVITSMSWLVILATAGLGFSGFFFNGRHESLREVVIVVSSIALAVFFAASLAALIHLLRRDDVTTTSRRWWLVGMWFANAIAVPLYWWRLARGSAKPSLRS
jgi:ABC-type maltose transport system permease subunit